MNTDSFLDSANIVNDPTNFPSNASGFTTTGGLVSDLIGPKSGHGIVVANTSGPYPNSASMKGGVRKYRSGKKNHSRKHMSGSRKHSRKHMNGSRKHSRKHMSGSRKHRGGSTVGYSTGLNLSPDNSFEANPPPITRYSCQSK